MQNTTFAEVLEQEEIREDHHYDLNVAASDVAVRINRHVLDDGDPSRIEIALPDAGWYRFGPYGQDQFLQKVGVPVIYARKCLANPGMDEELRRDIEGWLKRSDETWKFRCAWDYNRFSQGFDIVRGVVSERYVPFDNVDLLRALQPIAEARGLNVESLRQDDGHFNLRLVAPTAIDRSALLDPEQSDMYAGYVIRNSEIRLAAVSISAMIWRLICTNGLIAPVGDASVFRQIHYGKPAERVRAHLPEAIEAVDRQQSEMFDAYTKATQSRYDLEAAIRIASRIGDAASLTKAEVEALTDTIEEKGDVDRGIGGFELVNAMTEFAHASGLHFNEQDRLESEVGRFVLSH